MSIQIQPIASHHASGLAEAAQELAQEADSRSRLWWAKSDYSEEDAQSFIRLAATEVASGHSHIFALTDTSGRFLGIVSAKNLDKEHLTYQAGFWVRPTAQGRGMGFRALQLLWEVMKTHGYQRLEMYVGVNNPRSLHLAKKLGCHFEGLLRDRFRYLDGWMDVFLMVKQERA